jgi:voltage-gated potassium channel
MTKDIRKSIYNIINPDNSGNIWSRAYNWIMLLAIVVGLFPMMFRKQCALFTWFDIASCFCFLVDYILRWFTADYIRGKKDLKAFVFYPFTFMAIIDLLSILPTLSLLSPAFKIFRVSRVFKILRVIKFIRYYEPLVIIIAVIKKQRKILLTVLSLAVFYIFVTALIMFNAESSINPETGGPLFRDFFDALYWATCTLTTVGYGDIYPVTDLGRLISMLSSLMGIAIIALPSGIITAGYMDELRERSNQNK